MPSGYIQGKNKNMIHFMYVKKLQFLVPLSINNEWTKLGVDEVVVIGQHNSIGSLTNLTLVQNVVKFEV